MFAVVKTGGKQYVVSPNSRLKIEKITPNDKGEVIFDKVMLVVDGDKVEIGRPYIEGATVTAKVEKEGRARKVIVFKYRPKKRYKKKRGHRQPFTQVHISTIGKTTSKLKAEPKEKTATKK